MTTEIEIESTGRPLLVIRSTCSIGPEHVINIRRIVKAQLDDDPRVLVLMPHLEAYYARPAPAPSGSKDAAK